MLLLVTQCPTEGFVAELPLSVPRLGLSGHIPDPTKTPFNQPPPLCTRGKSRGLVFHCASDEFSTLPQDPLSHEDPEPTCSTLKSLTQRNSLRDHLLSIILNVNRSLFSKSRKEEPNWDYGQEDGATVFHWEVDQLRYRRF